MTIPARSARPYHNPTPHRFSLGQKVRLKGVAGRSPQSFKDTVYRVTGVLPTDGGSLQYRVQADNENFARTASELNLESAHDHRSVFSAV